VLEGAAGADKLIGGSGIDTLIVTGNTFNLLFASLSSVEVLRADAANGTHMTVFAIDQDDLAIKGSIVGNASATGDTILTSDTALDLSSTTLSSIEGIMVTSSTGTTLTMLQKQLVGETISGFGSVDALAVRGSLVDLSSTTLNSFEILTSTGTAATTFKADLADIKSLTVTGHAGIDTLIVNGTDFNLMSSGLSSIEKLQAASSDATTFTLNTTELGTVGTITGGKGTDELVAVNTMADVIDLSSIHLSSVEQIQVQTLHDHGTFTVGSNLGGVLLNLEANNQVDTVVFAAGYKAATVSSDATILAHSLSINQFGLVDVLDLSALTQGTPAHHTDMSSAIQSANPATLKAALNIAAAGDGSSTAAVVSFAYHGDTYVLVDNSASKTLAANDDVIKLVGAHTLFDASFVF